MAGREVQGELQEHRQLREDGTGLERSDGRQQRPQPHGRNVGSEHGHPHLQGHVRARSGQIQHSLRKSRDGRERTVCQGCQRQLPDLPLQAQQRQVLGQDHRQLLSEPQHPVGCLPAFSPLEPQRSPALYLWLWLLCRVASGQQTLQVWPHLQGRQRQQDQARRHGAPQGSDSAQLWRALQHQL